MAKTISFNWQQCQCADNDEHEEGQCPKNATVVGNLIVLDIVVVHLCDDCMGTHIALDEYNGIGRLSSICGFCKDEGIPPDEDDGEQQYPHGLPCPECGKPWNGRVGNDFWAAWEKKVVKNG